MSLLYHSIPLKLVHHIIVVKSIIYLNRRKIKAIVRTCSVKNVVLKKFVPGKYLQWILFCRKTGSIAVAFLR